MRARPPIAVEAIEPRRLLSADPSTNAELLDSQPSDAVVAEWKQPSIFWLRGEHIIASLDGLIDAGTDLARFEGTLPIDQYSVTIDWGDGVTSAGMLQRIGERGYRVFGTHEYASVGKYSVQVHIAASDGHRQTNYLTAVPHAEPLHLIHQSALEEPQEDGTRLFYNVFFYPSFISNTDLITATIDWGDGTIMQFRVSEIWSGAMAGMMWHHYAAPGTYHVTFTATGPTYGGDVATLVISKSVELLGHYPSSEPGERAVLFGDDRAIAASQPKDVASLPPVITFSRASMFASPVQPVPLARSIFAEQSIDAVEWQ